MEILTTNKSAVDLALEKQRRESEARAILQDLERLITISVERKRRWVWELIQNAKDCAPKHETEEKRTINITFQLSQHRLTFAHDGVPFTLENLLAIVRRTSTKSYDNEDGNTGKFGTGFVTTHVLNRKAYVSGLLENELGIREFSICIDRTPETLEGLQRELNTVFGIINSFYETTPVVFDTPPLTKYEYALEPDTLQLAEESLEELKKNLPFTLLINPTINSVTIIDERTGANNVYSIGKSKEAYPGVHFSKLTDGNAANSDDEKGLLHNAQNNITIAVPVEKKHDVWYIDPIGKQARLYREFPLIGTEQWRIPFFVQSHEFLPSEPRDGVRTLKDNETKPDRTADENRATFVKFRDEAITFFKNLQAGAVERLFLLTESGLPIEKTEYTAAEWFTENIQKPLRIFFLTHPLMKTASGQTIAINKARFPQYFIDDATNKLFYSIAVKYYYGEFPNESSFEDWQRIISQDTASWGNSIISTPEELVDDLNKPSGLQPLKLQENETAVKWLNKLIGFLHTIDKSALGENKNLYPNQEGRLKKKQELRVDPPLNPNIKSIGVSLNQPVLRLLLDNGITHREGIDLFDTKAFFNSINKTIGELIPSDVKLNEYRAVFELVSMFTESTAKERERWHQLAKQLLPDMVGDREVHTDMGEFIFGSAELASIKYVCWLIEKAKDFKTFCATYFQDQEASAYEWLNNLIEVLFRNQDYEELIRKHSVIPMQNGLFRKLETGVYREDKKAPFDLLFKTLYTSYTDKGDAKAFLVACEIKNENLPWKTSEILTNSIDNLFIAYDVEKKVEPDGVLNPLFHELNNWIATKEEEGELLFPHFSRQRPMLYIKAFGPEVSKMVMAIHKLNKPIEEIVALANLNMSAVELEELVKASQMAGGTEKLLQAAAEIEEEAKNAEWRKNVGDAAENAFKEAMADIEAYNLENPDRGFDFEIHFPNNDPYLLEIKSTVVFKENVQMSGLQGRTARDQKQRYALCVLAREQHDTTVTKEYFIGNAKFVTTIGSLVENKVNGMDNGLQTLNQYKAGEVITSLDDEQYSVYVNKGAWNQGISFNDFIVYLKTHFQA
ncbi:MAG: hypothetical protein H7282_12230 [Cytophagaceae bacterium]|nr:hypothetical protein [Cytophagaceae bacterium]